MDEKTKNSGKSRLGQALQDAALENINEDLNSISNTLEVITKRIPLEVRKRLLVLHNDINSMQTSLEVVPEQFDQNYTKKMNDLLDVVSEIDKHSRNLSISLNTQFQKQVKEGINNEVAKHKPISGTQITILLLIAAFSGGLFSALLVWTIFPRLF